MDSYKTSLEALYYLLDKVGVNGWRNWIAKDLNEWESGSVIHHLSAYGGMGSLNDVVICTENGHSVVKMLEPWVNILFEDLKGLCYSNAKHNNIGEKELIKSLWSNAKEIQGERCLDCGYSLLSTYSIERYIAPDIIKDLIVNSYKEKSLITLIDRILAYDIPGREHNVQDITKIAQRSNIVVEQGYSSWMRPCPNCNSDNTAVYRWVVEKTLFKERLIPSRNNLPMRKNQS